MLSSKLFTAIAAGTTALLLLIVVMQLLELRVLHFVL